MKNKNEKLQNGVMKLDIDELEGVAGGDSDGESSFINFERTCYRSYDTPLFKTGDIVTYRSTKAMVITVGRMGGINFLEYTYEIRIIQEDSAHLNEQGWTYEHQIVLYFNLHEMFPTVF